MKLIITAKTGKGENSTENQIDKTVDVVEKIVFKLEKKGYKAKGCRCMSNGTSIILEK